MSVDGAKEELLVLVTTLKLTEKEILSLEDEAAKWKSRIDLARASSRDDLLVEAEKEAERINAKLAGLREEGRALREDITSLQRQLPGLAARERSVDPDLLEQELLMALGRTEEETETEKAFRKLEQENSVDTALQTIKNKMKEDAS